MSRQVFYWWRTVLGCVHLHQGPYLLHWAGIRTGRSIHECQYLGLQRLAHQPVLDLLYHRLQRASHQRLWVTRQHTGYSNRNMAKILQLAWDLCRQMLNYWHLQVMKMTMCSGWPTLMTSVTLTTDACWATKRSSCVSRKTLFAGMDGIIRSTLNQPRVCAPWMTSCGKTFVGSQTIMCTRSIQWTLHTCLILCYTCFYWVGGLKSTKMFYLHGKQF